MDKEFFEHWAKQASAALGPMQELNELVVDSMNQAAQLQLESVKYYSELYMQRLEAGLKLREPKDVQDYLTEQMGVVRQVGEKAASDAQTLTQMGMELGSKAQQVMHSATTGKGKKAA